GLVKNLVFDGFPARRIKFLHNGDDVVIGCNGAVKIAKNNRFTQVVHPHSSSAVCSSCCCLPAACRVSPCRTASMACLKACPPPAAPAGCPWTPPPALMTLSIP